MSPCFASERPVERDSQAIRRLDVYDEKAPWLQSHGSDVSTASALCTRLSADQSTQTDWALPYSQKRLSRRLRSDGKASYPSPWELEKLQQATHLDEIAERSRDKRRDQLYTSSSGPSGLSLGARANEIRRRKPVKAETRVCGSCAEERSSSQFSAKPLTARCSQEDHFCIPCVQEWIERQLNDIGWNMIRCIGCDNAMEWADIKRHATKEVFERYDQLAARSVINEDPDFMWCPSGCGEGQIRENRDDSPLFLCHNCGYQYCTKHEAEWHTGETCRAFDRRMEGLSKIEEGEVLDSKTMSQLGIDLQEYSARSRSRKKAKPPQSTVSTQPARQMKKRPGFFSRVVGSFFQILNGYGHQPARPASPEPISSMVLSSEAQRERQKQREAAERIKYKERLNRKAEEALGEQTVRIHAKKCPNCKWWIQKSAGCDSMTCKKCKHNFCWSCLAPYRRIRRRGNSAHEVTCLHWRPRK